MNFAEVLSGLYKGAIVQIIEWGEPNEWLKIMSPGGRIEEISKSDVRIISGKEIVSALRKGLD